ncbi:hypothetical protein VCR20J5_1240061 [Vibrio crassostreae]|nr:hypothetical protein VCR20J5_1240061 [Vibrio crassostreae]
MGEFTITVDRCLVAWGDIRSEIVEYNVMHFKEIYWQSLIKIRYLCLDTMR